MGCPELGKALFSPVWGKQPQLAPDMAPNWQVPWITRNHNTEDEFEASTGGIDLTLLHEETQKSSEEFLCVQH